MNDHSTNNYIKLSVSLFCVITFLIFSYISSSNVIIASDTERYYEHFNNIKVENFPYKTEFFISLLMNFSAMLGGNFYSFVFLTYVLWVPVVAWLSYNSTRVPMYAIIMLFFFTPHFFVNASFLMRQYLCLLFFILYLFVKDRKYKILFLFFSFGSHAFSMLLFVVTRKMFFNILFHNYSRVFLFLCIVVVHSLNINISSFLLSSLYNLFGGLAWAIDRKLVMLDFIDSAEYSLSGLIIIINALIFMLFTIFGVSSSLPHAIKFFSAILFFSSFLFLMNISVPIFANRLAFVTYFFSWPSLLFSIYFALSLYNKNRSGFVK